MFQTILIACDGSPHDTHTLRFGGALARRFGARVVVATAYAHTPPSRASSAPFESMAHHDAEAVAREAAAGLEGIADVRSQAAPGGSIEAALHAAAADARADLVVVGTSERRHIAGLQPGSHTERVLHHSPCAVVAVPPLDVDGEPALARIGVALDAETSRVALDAAIGLIDAEASPAKELVLLTVEPVEMLTLRVGAAPKPGHVETPEWLRATADELEVPVPVRLLHATGDVPKGVVELAKDLDLLIMGAHDRGAIRRVVLGSVSTHVVRNAPCPTMVIPAGATLSSGRAAKSTATG